MLPFVRRFRFHRNARRAYLARFRPSFADLEQRCVPALPTSVEQEMLEWVNRFRAAPAVEFDRYYDTVTQPNGSTTYLAKVPFLPIDKPAIEEFRGEMLGTSPTAPLAWNTKLNDAARFHTDFMIAADDFAHQLPGEPSVGTRISNTGYPAWGWGENIAYGHGQIRYSHSSLVHSDGHRANLASAGFTEIGIAAGYATPANDVLFDPIVTQNFGDRFGRLPSVLGVVFDDSVTSDDFYQAGEGLQGISITLAGTQGIFVTTSWGSGGYQFDDVPAGNYRLYVSSPGIDADAYSYQVTVGASNLKYDFEIGSPPTVSVGFESATAKSVDEGGTAVFAIVRSGPLDEALDISVVPADRPGAARPWNSVIAALPGGGIVSFQPGQARATFQVTTLQDTVRNPDITLDFVLTPNDPGYTTSLSTNSLTVVDDDRPRIAFVAFDESGSTQTVRESQRQAVVTLQRSGDLTRRVVVPWSITPLTGQNHVSAQNGQAVFEIGSTQATVTIAIVDDTVARPHSTFAFRLGPPQTSDTTIQGSSERIVSVIDDDPKPRLVRISGRRSRQNLSTLTATLDAPIGNANTRTAGIWQITDAGADGLFDTADDVGVALRSVSYRSQNRTFTLNFRTASRSRVARSYRITLDASKLVTSIGTPLDGPVTLYLNA